MWRPEVKGSESGVASGVRSRCVPRGKGVSGDQSIIVFALFLYSLSDSLNSFFIFQGRLNNLFALGPVQTLLAFGFWFEFFCGL